MEAVLSTIFIIIIMNGWSYTSIPPLWLHGVDRENIIIIIIISILNLRIP